jgi:Ser/Thr protein kinase RdoA (MazF antagonist)
MHPSLLEEAARCVLSRYPVFVSGVSLISLGNRGGFSGARLWRVEGSPHHLCLRAWPPDGISAERLTYLHQLMHLARKAGLAFVPPVVATNEGLTWVEHGGQLWELTAWLPGRADFHERPVPTRLESACTALALLHGAWSGVAAASGPCPAIERRLDTLREWTALLQSGWRPQFAGWEADPVRPWAERAWRIWQLQGNQLPPMLAPWTQRVWPLQPCLCDVWHDHLLFEGDQLTGLVDYGGAKLDHIAVDLARLLGSTAGDDTQLRAIGLGAYTRIRPLSASETELIQVLDETGTLLGMTNWLKWLYQEQRTFEDRHAVARRLASLVERVENWHR